VKGITAYGVYLPYYRLKRKTIFKAMAWFNPGTAGLAKGEKAVANFDEDSLTMAVAAGMDCFADIDRSQITSLALASTTLPYAERGNGSIAAGALNLAKSVRASDFTGCLKAGTTALISALNSADSDNTLVCASDCRLSKAGGAQEQMIGDGAGALVVGNKNIIANLIGHYSTSYDFADHRRLNSDKYIRSWEERWMREAGYIKMIPEVINAVLLNAGINIADINKVIFPPLNIREHKGMVKKLGLAKEQVQDHFLGSVGHTGTALPIIMLAAALDQATPGDKILVVSMGSGCDAILFEITPEITKLKNRNKLQKNLDYKTELENYAQYLSFKGMLDKEIGIRGEEVSPTSVSLQWREQNAILSLSGARCKACGTPQYPKETVCINPDCVAIDQMEDYPFFDKTGRLFTYTADHLAFTENPPGLYGIVDFDGGGRFWFDITDCSLDDLKVGQPVQMTFRRRYLDEVRGIVGYFWKAMPFKS